jgi:cobalt-precorrin-5B (C1)-methyltransferase
MERKRRIKERLRSGYTTGACAAAAAKAASMVLLRLPLGAFVQIPFPDGSHVYFKLKDAGLAGEAAWASVIKDAGDDPDVTNGAEIKAEARIIRGKENVLIKGGKGVGMVTRPGLPVPVGQPAINPVPQKMITEAVTEAIKESRKKAGLEITVIVPEGERLAKKTLNSRLGIVGGISILGTTGIVIPLSDQAWKASITASMDVARASGLKEIVLSAGRTSELAHMKEYKLPESAYVLMGDYAEWSFLEAKKHGFEKIHLCAQWAKMLKLAMATPDTHVRAGAINIKKAVSLLKELGVEIPEREYNTAREIFKEIKEKKPLIKVSKRTAAYAGKISGIAARAYLVSYEGDIIAKGG